MSDRRIIGTALTSGKPGGTVIIGIGHERLSRRQLLKVRLRFAWRRLRGRGSLDGRVLHIPVVSNPLMPPGVAYLADRSDEVRGR